MVSYLILASGRLLQKSADQYYPFRVDSDFLAWTGMDIEGAIVLIFLDETQKAVNQVLFFDEPKAEKRIWSPIKWDTASIRAFGFTGEILPQKDMASYLRGISGDQILLPSKGSDATREIYTKIRKMIRKNGYKDFIQSADDTLVQKRVIKTPEEIIKVEYATRVTNEIYDALLLFAKPGMYEYEIEAFIKSQFIIRSGVEFFETIVASGVNACTLHYIANNRKIEAGDIVLIDFGIEIDGYGADISRTFPISGEFTPRQKELYDGVLATKKYAESILKSGISILEMNRQIHHFMIHELFPEIGLQVSTSSVKLNNPFMPHSIGHFLGIDVHDVGDRDGALELGMVVTIEPGIYVKEEGIGIRIEDDYLVTEDGCRRL